MSDVLVGFEIDRTLLIAMFASGAVCGVIGWLVARLTAQRRITTLRVLLEQEMESSEEKIAGMENAFAAMSADALHRNNQSFLDLAEQTMERFHQRASGDLKLREQAVAGLVAPLRDSLVRTERSLREFDQGRREAHSALSQNLHNLIDTHKALQGETRNLVQALRRPEVRGRWGELTLRRLVELAGLVEHCDFSEQLTVQTENGPLRPDMIIHMPGGREVVVDAKTPLDAYLSAVDAGDDAIREQHLKRHAVQVRARVRELAGKAYWEQFSQATDFVVLFIPGDQFLSAALDQDPDLLEHALADRVILASPGSLVALLRAVAYGWRQEQLTRNADAIRNLAEELYRRLGTFAEHLSQLGRHLDQSVTQFNRLVGSFDSKVLPAARRFAAMGVTTKKTVDEAQPVQTRPRRGPADEESQP